MDVGEALLVAGVVLSGGYLVCEGWHHLRCRRCRVARQALRDQYPGWRPSTLWFLSHRGTDQGWTVIAVFYDAPGWQSRPAPYKLFAVAADFGSVVELPITPGSPFQIRGRK
jgi:hypothetical protein